MATIEVLPGSIHGLLPTAVLSYASRFKDCFVKDQMGRLGEEMQGVPFLRMGVVPQVGMSLYLQVGMLCCWNLAALGLAILFCSVLVCCNAIWYCIWHMHVLCTFSTCPYISPQIVRPMTMWDNSKCEPTACDFSTLGITGSHDVC